MPDISSYRPEDLVLKVSPSDFDFEAWEFFLDRLCRDREYQKEAIKQAIIFLASQKYTTTQDLVEENQSQIDALQERHPELGNYYKNLQLPDKLFANIDLATGTGKSYVIYGIAQIMLGLGLVDKVLVLCPSVTIEDGLTEKFQRLSGDAQIKQAIPSNVHHKNPSIVNGNVTVQPGSICVENIHAVYKTNRSSIEDSFQGQGEHVLVLNDESHHIFNKISGNTTEARDLKEWKKFLLKPNFNFKYILGFTGTAYHDNQYFNDVIYRYSLRQAIDNRFVKKIKYVLEGSDLEVDQKFQVINQNHKNNIKEYPEIQPISILVTQNISRAKDLQRDLIDFLKEEEDITQESAEERVLIVTSAPAHEKNLDELKKVDDKSNFVEWIVSVSMLTEGWDVQNVFQIVPWEDRAFNSKLLIAQVMGRGLRLPDAYKSQQPEVIVFNHDAWGREIEKLVDAVLEEDKVQITSESIKKGGRAEYHFDVYNFAHATEEVEAEYEVPEVINYPRIEKEGIPLESQSAEEEKVITYRTQNETEPGEELYSVKYRAWTAEEVADKVYEELQIRDWKGMLLQLGKKKYIKSDPLLKDKIHKIILISTKERNIEENKIMEKNKNIILDAFSGMLQKEGRMIVPKFKAKDLVQIYTKDIKSESCGISNFRRDYSLFYTGEWKSEIPDRKQRGVIEQFIKDKTLLKSADNKLDLHLFKTPINVVFANSEPEREFIEYLCQKEVADKISGWLKSRDRGFYSIEYSRQLSARPKIGSFNPDFFIQAKKGHTEYSIVVEIKADKDDSDENRAKYKYGKEHFKNLNQKLQEKKIKQKYIFHFLSPEGYKAFFTHLKDRTILEGQKIFRCELENRLEEAEKKE